MKVFVIAESDTYLYGELEQWKVGNVVLTDAQNIVSGDVAKAANTGDLSGLKLEEVAPRVRLFDVKQILEIRGQSEKEPFGYGK